MTTEREARAVLGVSVLAEWPEVRTAYRTLARLYHADGTMPHEARMVEINAAYECLERAHRERHSDSPGIPVGPGRPGPDEAAGPGFGRPPEGSLLSRMRAAEHIDTPVMDFGQYAGWRIAEIAECDPRYLRWLSRHSSGIRFRASIEQVLGAEPELRRRASAVR